MARAASSNLSTPPTDAETAAPVVKSKKRAQSDATSRPANCKKTEVNVEDEAEAEEAVIAGSTGKKKPARAKRSEKPAVNGKAPAAADQGQAAVNGLAEAPTLKPAKRSRKKTAAVKGEEGPIIKAEAVEEQIEEQAPKNTPNKRRRVKKEVDYKQEDDQLDGQAKPEAPLTTPKRKTKKATKTEVKTEAPADGDPAEPPKPKRKRKTAEEKAAEMLPLAARTLSSKVNIGAHVSAGGGVHNTIQNSLHIGGNAFALFLKSQRKWENPALKDEHAESFKSMCAEHKYLADKVVVPHGSYLVNLAAKDEAKKVQAYNCFLDDVKRCTTLGIRLYNFHPGNTNGEPREEALQRIADRLNEAHEATAGSPVVTLLENMAAGNNTVGGPFSDLRGIIDRVKDKSRVGVCFDTCHAFAYGYDLRSSDAFAATMQEFEDTVGFEYLRAVHMNDSKGPLASNKDLHFNIGWGCLGLRAFWNLVNDVRFHGLPLILETPIDEGPKDEKGKAIEDKGVWAREIKLLESLVGMNPEGKEFKAMEADLAAKGTKERDRLQEVVYRKGEERKKKAEKAATKGKKGKKKDQGESEGESSGLSEGEDD